jgi:hypothetical protein
MSRRRARSHSPTESAATARFMAQQVDVALAQILETVSEREAGVIRMLFGVGDGPPRTLADIGRVYGVSQERIRQIQSKTLSKLRHPSRSQILWDYTVDDVKLSDAIRRVQNGNVEPALVWCDRHGWSAPEGSHGVCGRCKCPVWFNGVGRPPKYCSDACRKAASRARLKGSS